MKNFEKEIKQCYEFFRETVLSDSYRQYKDNRKKDSLKSHLQYVAENYPDQVERTDTYENALLTEVKIYDTLTNDGVTKLIQKLYSLPKKKFKIQNRYRKPTAFKHYDYVPLQLTGTETDTVADIEFLNDEYIKTLSIGWCHIDSFSVYVEYAFSLRKCLPEDAQRQFVLDRMSFLNKNDYRTFYITGENQEEKYYSVLQLEENLLLDIFRHYVTTLFFSEYGKNHPLTCLLSFTRQEPVDINTLCLSPFHSTWYNRKDNYAIIDQNDGAYYLLAGENHIPNFSFFHLINRYGNVMYFALNGWDNLEILRREFSKYSTHRRHIRKKKLLVLLNNLQGLRESQRLQADSRLRNFDKDWICYRGNKRKEFSTLYDKYIENLRNIYEENFLYFQTVATLDMSQTNQWLSIIAIAIAVITLILTA